MASVNARRIKKGDYIDFPDSSEPDFVRNVQVVVFGARGWVRVFNLPDEVEILEPPEEEVPTEEEAISDDEEGEPDA